MRLDVLNTHRGIRLAVAHDKRERTLAPTSVLNPDDGTLANTGAMHDDVFELKRGDPFAAGLDDVLQAIRDPQIAVRSDDPDVVGMEVAARPELLGGVGI